MLFSISFSKMSCDGNLTLAETYDFVKLMLLFCEMCRYEVCISSIVLLDFYI